MRPAQFFGWLHWATCFAAFFIAIGMTGSLIVGGIAALVPAVLAIMAGAFERIDPRIGLPFFRWSLYNGTYEEPPRAVQCKTCHGRGWVDP